MIHATAIVDPRAQLAEDVEVGPYAIIDAGVEVGAGSRIGPHVVIKGPTRIGSANHIFQFASIGDDPQDKKYAGEETRLEIGDRNTIREFCTINRGTAQDRGCTSIGSDNWIMAYVHIAHDCVVGDQTVLANNATLAGHVDIGDFAVLGGFTGIHQFCSVGAHAFLGMFTGLTQDVPPYITVAGVPAAPKGVNAEGLRRRGFSAQQIRHIRHAYRLLYRSGLKLEEAVQALEELSRDQPELRPLVEFLARSERGILR